MYITFVVTGLVPGIKPPKTGTVQGGIRFNSEAEAQAFSRWVIENADELRHEAQRARLQEEKKRPLRS